MAENANNNENENRQLQIRNMQGLLNFCTNATASEDTTKDTPQIQLDPERREFLENVLRGMQGNTTKHMSDIIALLSQNLCNTDDVDAQEEGLDDLAEYIEDLNHAVDFYKMNGFPVIVKVLTCPHVRLQCKAARVLGHLCQNNIECQKNMLALGPMRILLNIIDKSSSVDHRVKCLFAVSCLVRGYAPAEKEFVDLNGLHILMNLLRTEALQIIIKVVFVLHYFVSSASMAQEVGPQLVENGLVEAVVNVYFNDESEATLRENCMNLLFSLLVQELGTPELMQPDLNLLHRLVERRNSIRNNEEFEDEVDCINDFLPRLYELHGLEMEEEDLGRKKG